MSAPFAQGPPPLPGASSQNVQFPAPVREITRPRAVPTGNRNRTREQLSAKIARQGEAAAPPGMQFMNSAFIRTSVIVPNASSNLNSTSKLSPLPPQQRNLNAHPGVHTNPLPTFNVNFSCTYDPGACPPVGGPNRGTHKIYAVPPPGYGPLPSPQTSSSSQHAPAANGSSAPSTSRRKNRATPRKSNGEGQADFMAINRQIIELGPNGVPMPIRPNFPTRLSVPAAPISTPPHFPYPQTSPYSQRHHQTPKALEVHPRTVRPPGLEMLSNVASLMGQPSLSSSNVHLQNTSTNHIINGIERMELQSQVAVGHSVLPPMVSPQFSTSSQNIMVQDSGTKPVPLTPPQSHKHNAPELYQRLSQRSLPVKIPQAIRLNQPTHGPGRVTLGPRPIPDLLFRNGDQHVVQQTDVRGSFLDEIGPTPSATSARSNSSPQAPCESLCRLKIPNPVFSDPVPFRTPIQVSGSELPMTEVDRDQPDKIQSNLFQAYQKSQAKFKQGPISIPPDNLKKNVFDNSFPFKRGPPNGNLQSSMQTDQMMEGVAPRSKPKTLPKQQNYKSEFNVKASRDQKKLKFSKAETANQTPKFSSFKSKNLESKLPTQKAKQITDRIQRNKGGKPIPSARKSESEVAPLLDPPNELVKSGAGGPFFRAIDDATRIVISHKSYTVEKGGKLKLLGPLPPDVRGQSTAPFRSYDDVIKETTNRKKLDQKKKSRCEKNSLRAGAEGVLDENSLAIGPALEPPKSKPERINKLIEIAYLRCRFTYTAEERSELYKHNSFLINRLDLERQDRPSTETYNIYRLIMKGELMVLQLYVAVKDDEQDRVFHYATNKALEVDKIDLTFFKTYQPVYYGICYGSMEEPSIIHVMWRRRLTQVLKHVFEVNYLFEDFLNMLEIMCGQVLTMTEIDRILKQVDSDPAKVSFQKLTNMIDDLASRIYGHPRWNQTSIEVLKPWPKLEMGNRVNRAGQKLKDATPEDSLSPCEFCTPAPNGTRGNYLKRAKVSGKRYDRSNHKPFDGDWEPPTYLRTCSSCADLLMTAHKLYHLKNDIFGCLVVIVEERLRINPEINGLELKKSILEHDNGHWARMMFLDFSINVGDGQKTLDKLDSKS